MSEATTPTGEAPVLELDDRDAEPRTPMKRLGSTRKLAAFNNIRVQLTEQTRILEARAEAAAGVAAELHDYCRRRAELEAEYSRALDKLVRAAHQKHKEHKHKREQWSLTGAYACWQAALDSTRSLSKDHATLAALYGGQLASRLQRAADDALRLHRKCRDIVLERHEEVGAALADAAAAGKAQAAAAAEWRAAAAKLRHAHDQKTRLAAADPPRVKKLKALDKELEKRRGRHSEARAKALRARADYVLSLEAANATLQRYYLDDIPDIMLCMEVGFEAVVGRCVRTAAEAEAARAAALCAAAGALRGAASALDSLKDRQKALDAHAPTFALPRPLPYQGTPPEEQDQEMRELVNGAAEEQDAAAAAVAAELAQRLQQLESGARALRAECRESAKTLDAAEAELVKQMEGSPAQWETARLFGPDAPAPPPTDDQEAPRKEQEDYYLAKFRSYVSSAGRLARLESKAACMRARLVRLAPAPPPASPPSPPRRAAARLRRGQFAAPLDDHLAAARADLPRVLTSCVRVISSYGLRHQGIFRVSGSQVEMQALRAAFERGDDPLAHVRDASDINSVCGLLKLYLRELRPPLLPPQLQERLLRLAALPSDADFVRRMRELLATLPASSVLVLRYLLAFLAHLTEYSEYNMMDAWNLAICVGPTLLAAWGEGGAQLAAQNLVNELVKRTIIHHAAIFPQDIAPHALYKRPSEENETVAEEGESAAGSDDVDAAEEPDVNDDLSLYDDDDDNDDDEISDDGENGEWRERDRDSIERRSESLPRRQSVPAPQVREPSPAAPAPSTSAQCRRLAEATPDLVLDLPARAPTEASAPPADAAETFASNRDTLKKRPSHKPSSSDSSTIAPDDPPEAEKPDEAETQASASAAPESPVPARNTARVAAKFADLTLTGGSLKPALAAKPALLRRPTPHPQHARPHPPPDEAT